MANKCDGKLTGSSTNSVILKGNLMVVVCVRGAKAKEWEYMLTHKCTTWKINAEVKPDLCDRDV